MSKEMEGLVEEIADYLQASYAMGQHDYKLGLGYGKTPRKWDKNGAKKIIARIGKAYARQDLLLPEEAGRAVWAKQGDEDHIYDWVADTIENGARTFIALCEEESD